MNRILFEPSELAAMGVGRLVLVGAAKVEKAFWGAQLLKEEIYHPLLVDGLMQAGTTALPTIQLERGFGRWLEGGRFEEQFAGQLDRIVAHPDPQATSHEPRAALSLPSGRRAAGPTTRWCGWRRTASGGCPSGRASCAPTRRRSRSSRA